ncbi:MAG: pyridoxamine 5'-phosphate oxidase family protein [Acidimicrobiales bacterium]
MSDFYTADQRQLQDDFETRPLADTLVAVMVKHELADVPAAFIESRDFFFLSTVTPEGEPTVSYKGGAPGFVRVIDEHTLAFPSYDGNGMFLSLGNIISTAKIGMLFIDFETPHRLRVQATAQVAAKDDPIVEQFPGADLVVVATVDAAFVNCGRYIHKHTRTEDSPYVPADDGSAPLPAWKRIDALQDALPPRDQGRAELDGGTIDGAEYAEGIREGRP